MTVILVSVYLGRWASVINTDCVVIVLKEGSCDYLRLIAFDVVLKEVSCDYSRPFTLISF